MTASPDFEAYYRAIQAKDARFDGKVFVGVRSTGIFCRPICPARTPKPENCEFFVSAAAAHSAGFRPCLRCRPEISPCLYSYVGTASTVSRALRLIAEGALDSGTVQHLATRLGVGDRHLRQLFVKHVGTSPNAVAQMRRLAFAKQLLDETSLSMTDIAMAAGFSSIRRFNETIHQTYGRSPSQLRKQTVRDRSTTPEITLKLPYSQPYSWETWSRFLSTRMTAGLESIRAGVYHRTILLNGQPGMVEVKPVDGQSHLLATIRYPNVALLGHIVERLRRLFDLDAAVLEITAQLAADPILQPVMQANRGLRVPGAWDAFELAVRAILGQQITVAAATTLASRLVAAYGTPFQPEDIASSTDLTWIFPSPETLAIADLTSIGLTRSRAAAISSLGTAVAQDATLLSRNQGLDEAVQRLTRCNGIGEWTAHYIAMRALGEPDAFPATDVGLLRAMQRLGHRVTPTQLQDISQVWRPWRAYAAMALWLSLDPAPVPPLDNSSHLLSRPTEVLV
jgi:AraC family transcriptional regulator of adaptative response / DNA-3-methyladenine glycosylase II